MNTAINKLIPYFYVILFAYLLSSILNSKLPKEDINFIQKNDTALEYRKYSGFYSNIKENVAVKQELKREIIKVQTLDKYRLRGIYSTQSNSGWINIEDEKANKGYILAQWEELEGYMLTKLFKNHVIFEKAGVEYKLEIKKDDEKVAYEITKNDNNKKEQIVVRGDSIEVNRDYLNSYVNDIEKVWNNISIIEVKNGDRIDGFKVLNVVKGSVFEKLGLKQGDIIKAVNNNILASYADAFKVYNNINDTKYLNIEILRNNEVMELNYEIN